MLDALQTMHRSLMGQWVRGKLSEPAYERAKCWIQSAEHALINLEIDLGYIEKEASALTDSERSQAREVEARA